MNDIFAAVDTNEITNTDELTKWLIKANELTAKRVAIDGEISECLANIERVFEDRQARFDDERRKVAAAAEALFNAIKPPEKPPEAPPEVEQAPPPMRGDGVNRWKKPPSAYPKDN
jgi:hypothetical protein